MRSLPIPVARPKPIITNTPPLSHNFTAHTLSQAERQRHIEKTKINVPSSQHLIAVTIEGYDSVTVTVPRMAGHSQGQIHKAAFALAKAQLKIT